MGNFIVNYSFKAISVIKSDVFELTNQKRNKKGLDALKRNKFLDKAAQGHAEAMDVSGKYLAHIGSNGSTAEERIKATDDKAG